MDRYPISIAIIWPNFSAACCFLEKKEDGRLFIDGMDSSNLCTDDPFFILLIMLTEIMLKESTGTVEIIWG